MIRDMFVLAPIGKRFSAQFIDGAVGFLLSYIALIIAEKIFHSNGSVSTNIMLTIFIGYTLMADGMPNGQSLGKKILKLYVINAKTNEPCTYAQSIIRNATYILGIIDWIFIIGNDRKRLGDRLANTKVIMAL